MRLPAGIGHQPSAAVSRPRATTSTFEWGPSPTNPLFGHVTYNSLFYRMAWWGDPWRVDTGALIPPGVIDGPQYGGHGVNGLYYYGPLVVDLPAPGRSGVDLFRSPYIRPSNHGYDPLFGRPYAGAASSFPVFVGFRLSRFWSTDTSPFSVTRR